MIHQSSPVLHEQGRDPGTTPADDVIQHFHKQRSSLQNYVDNETNKTKQQQQKR